MTVEDIIATCKSEDLIDKIEKNEKFIYIYNKWSHSPYIISINSANTVKYLENHLKLFRNFKAKLMVEDSDFLRCTPEYQNLIDLGYEDVTNDKQEEANKIALKIGTVTYIIFIKKNDEDLTPTKKYITTIESKSGSNNSHFIFKVKTANIIKGVREAFNKLKDLKNV